MMRTGNTHDDIVDTVIEMYENANLCRVDEDKTKHKDPVIICSMGIKSLKEMKKNLFNQYISTANFKELFISEMLWNNPTGATQLPEITIDDTTYHIEQIAERKGFQILNCKVNQIPTIGCM